MSTAELVCTAISGWLTAIFGLFKWWCEIRQKRQERTAKEKAEAELKEIRRRSSESSPYFVLSEARFNTIIIPADEPGKRFSFNPLLPHLLSFMHEEVNRDLEAGEFIYLLVENHGNAAHEVTIQLDSNPATLLTVEVDHCHQFYAIRYAYRPQHHGRVETVKIRFLARNGCRDTHTYLTAHGVRRLKRTDPQ